MEALPALMTQGEYLLRVKLLQAVGIGWNGQVAQVLARRPEGCMLFVQVTNINLA